MIGNQEPHLLSSHTPLGSRATEASTNKVMEKKHFWREQEVQLELKLLPSSKVETQPRSKANIMPCQCALQQQDFCFFTSKSILEIYVTSPSFLNGEIKFFFINFVREKLDFQNIIKAIMTFLKFIFIFIYQWLNTGNPYHWNYK
jgi:hypothetical protein